MHENGESVTEQILRLIFVFVTPYYSSGYAFYFFEE